MRSGHSGRGVGRRGLGRQERRERRKRDEAAERRRSGSGRRSGGEAGRHETGSRTGRREEPRLTEALAELSLDGRERLEPEELGELVAAGPWGRLGPETLAILGALRPARQPEAESGLSRAAVGHIWRRLERWDAAFVARDAGETGRMPRGELSAALAGLGYRLSGELVDGLAEELLGLPAAGQVPAEDYLAEEEFIQLAGLLEAVTSSFKQRDASRRGEVLYSYQLFLQDALRLILRLQLYR